MQEKTVLHEGDRVRLLRDLPDASVPLKAGMLGTAAKINDDFGVRFDGHDSVSFRRELEGERVFVIDYCELVEAAPALEISDIPSSADACPTCGVPYGDDMDTEDCVICGSAADTTIAVCKECAEDLVADFPEVDYRGIEAQLSKLQPLRYEVKTLLQDLEDTRADNSLSQCLNQGWEILELSHHVVDELDGETIIREFRRVVTLRRAVAASVGVLAQQNYGGGNG